jgi:hypothetical protein
MSRPLTRPASRFAAAALLALLTGPADAADVKLEKKENRVAVTIDGKPFTDYYFAEEGGRKYVRPFCWPVRAADGTEVTSDQSRLDNGDHPHHRSLWVAQGDVNGVDHWAFVKNPQARQRHVKFPMILEDTIVQDLEWTTGDGKGVLLNERRTLTFGALADGSRTVDIKSVYAPAERDKPVTFGDTKEAGLAAVRVNKAISDTVTITTSEASGAGKAAEKAIWGRAAKWCDLSGKIDGKDYGVAIFDHPGNPRFPTRWHVRAYGLMGANPFGLHDFDSTKEKKVPPGTGNLQIKEPTTFRYRVVIHQGTAKDAKLAEAFEAWAGAK